MPILIIHTFESKINISSEIVPVLFTSLNPSGGMEYEISYANLLLDFLGIGVLDLGICRCIVLQGFVVNRFPVMKESQGNN